MIKKELAEPSKEKMQTILAKGIFVETILYLMIAFSGYFSMLNETPPLIIVRPKLANSKDYLMLIGRFGVIIKVVTSLTLASAPCRE